MKVYVELTNAYYDMNNPEHRMILRQHLNEAGFFNHQEHKGYWSLLEQSSATPEEAESMFKSIKLYQFSLMPKRPEEIN